MVLLIAKSETAFFLKCVTHSKIHIFFDSQSIKTYAFFTTVKLKRQTNIGLCFIVGKGAFAYPGVYWTLI